MSPSATTAVVFPGQGSQTEDMRVVAERHAPELLEAVIAAVGDDPFTRLQDGTQFVQPAIFCCSVASWRSVAAQLEPVAFAGHSLGELAALVAAEVLSADDGARLAASRGRLAARAVSADECMLAVMGIAAKAAEEIAGRHSVHLANYNSPRQQVLAGKRAALELAGEAVREQGGSAVMLAVNGAFHCPVMRDAAEAFRGELENVEVHRGTAEVFCGTTAKPFENVREQLASSLTAPVRWVEVVESLSRAGVEEFIETAPGKVLSGLIKRIDRTVTVTRIDQVGAAV